MTILIDSYDSFSYNLYQLVGELDPTVKVIRNDEMTVEELEALHPDRIILSPGPGRPEDAGILIETVLKLGPKIPILGVCLGHQAICAAYGATVTYAKILMHGKSSQAAVDFHCPLFNIILQKNPSACIFLQCMQRDFGVCLIKLSPETSHSVLPASLFYFLSQFFRKFHFKKF